MLRATPPAPAVGPGRHHAEPTETLAPPPVRGAFSFRRRWLVLGSIAAVAAIAIPVCLMWIMSGEPSGTLVFPASRGYSCRAGGEFHDRSAACQAAARVRPINDGSGLGDGTGVEIPDVGDRHHQVIPDSRLCSAGRERFRGLDLTRDDWPATALPSGGVTTLRYQLNGNYRGRLTFYLTLAQYDSTAPLNWSSLTEVASFSGSPNRDGLYQVKVRLPARSGRQLLYTIWEQSNGTAALYSCSDVVFGGTAGSDAAEGTTPPTQSAPGQSTPGPTTSVASSESSTQPSPTQQAGASEAPPIWVAGVAYDVGDVVFYRGIAYRCVQPHRSIRGWEPTSAPALWETAD